MPGAPDSDRERLEVLLARAGREPAAFADAASLASAAGWTPAKLARLSRHHYHAAPETLLERAGVRWAAEQLLATRRRPREVGLSAGFASGEAFATSFVRLTGLSPSDYRRLATEREFALRLPPAFRALDVLRFLGRDPASPTETVSGRTGARALVLEGKPARLLAELDGSLARCRVESRRSPAPTAMAEAHRIALRWLGLTLDPAEFEGRASRRPRWRRLVAARAGLRIPQTPSVFEGLVWAIAGQQVNLAFARTLRRRLIELAGRRLDGRLVAHPTPAEVARLEPSDLLRLQFSRNKAEFLIEIARSSRLDFEALPDGPATAAEEILLALRGVGPWTAHYVLMRSCSFADCVPVGDSGLIRALQRLHRLAERPDSSEQQRLLAPLAPHRSLATFHLWTSLGDPA